MIGSASPHQRMIIATVAVGIALLAALWMLAISPKRSESATVKSNVAVQEQRLSAAQTQLASYEASRKQYPGLLAELRGLDEAVPARGRDLRAPAPAAEARQGAQRHAAARQPRGCRRDSRADARRRVRHGPHPRRHAPEQRRAGEAPVLVRVLGLATSTSSKILKEARRTVAVKSGDLKINGRLVTIEALTFQRETPESSLIKANVAGTAYIAAAPPTPIATAIPADAPQGGS